MVSRNGRRLRSAGRFSRRDLDLLYQKHTGAVMFKPVPLSALAGTEFVPQAIVDRPISYFAEKLNLPLTLGHDDFDEYEAAAVQVGDFIVELKHYAGYPENSTTIYLSYEIEDLARVTLLIGVIAEALGISRSWISWQRSLDPTL
jgi:hypothetical protein